MITFPDLSGGRCQPSPRPRFPPPEAWASDSPRMREAAVHACSTCPVLEPCLRWATSPGTPDGLRNDGAARVIVAGMDRAQRKAARRVTAAAS